MNKENTIIKQLFTKMEDSIKKEIEKLQLEIQSVKYVDSAGFLSITNASRFLRCSRTTIYNRIKDGSLTVQQLNGRNVISRAELMEVYK